MMLFWVVAAFAACVAQLSTAADKFSCEGRASGYYADIETGCQVYHMCDGLGRQFSYSCPNTTLFQQRMLICDHWYMVNCSKSELDYSANLLIGQRNKPFVEDSVEHPYHRTPRPDLLQQPYAPRYQDDDYRNGRAQSLPANLNLVGVATDEGDEFGKTDRPQYFLPSHWSTQYGKGGKNPTGDRKLPPPSFNYDPKYYKVPAAPKTTIIPPSPPRTSISPPSTFKNPLINKFSNINRADTFKIPDTINEASVSPSSLAHPPFVPKINEENIAKPSIYYQPPKFSSSFEVESTTMDPQTFYKLIPSKILLPPVHLRTKEVRPTTIKPTTTAAPKIVNKKDTETNSEKRWKELRQMFFIPEYDFPLEVVSRPSYEGGLSSFQVKIGPPNPESRRRSMSRASDSTTPNPDCPKCDPAFLAPGTCRPCVMIRR